MRTAAGTVLGLALSFAAGGCLAWRLWPARAKPALLLAALAMPAGLALTSSAYFLWLVVSGGRASWYPVIEVAALLGASFLVWQRQRARPGRLVLPPRPRLGMEAAALLVLSVAAVVSLTVILRYAEVSPWGYWDAWARINLKARHLHAGGADWTWMFRGDGPAQPDYPLLLECSVARLWQWSGGIDPLPAQALSVMTWVGCLAALVTLTASLRSIGVAVVAGLAFLCQRSDREWAAMQYADFALATYFLWGAGLLVFATRRRQRPERWWPLLGFCAGSAAWCKNEGLAFLLLVGMAVASLHWAAPGRWRAAAALGRGLLLGGFSVLVLKLGFAGKSFVFEARTRSIWQDVTDLSRYRMVADSLVWHLTSQMTGWALFLLALAIAVLPRGRRVRRSGLPLVLCSAMTLVFLLVLVTTHFDLEWLTSTTVDRFALQLWPLAILGVVVGLRSGA